MNLIRWCLLLVLAQCFTYKHTGFGFALNVGVTLTPDRLIFAIITLLTICHLAQGHFRLARLGGAELCLIALGVIGTISSLAVGGVQYFLYYLFDLVYIPLTIFVIAKSIPYAPQSISVLVHGLTLIGAYLTINGVFEHFGPHALVWPQYILD